MKKMLWLTVFLLAGCSSGPPLFTDDGRPTVAIDCRPSVAGQCDQRARLACPSGFDLLGPIDAGNGEGVLVACRRRTGF